MEAWTESTERTNTMTDFYTCECGRVFDEFEMDYNAAQIDKRCLCNTCRTELINDAAHAVEEIDPDELEEHARKLKGPTS